MNCQNADVVFTLIIVVSSLATFWLLFGNWVRYYILKQPKIGSYYGFDYRETSSIVKVTGKDFGKVYYTMLSINGQEINHDMSSDYDLFLTCYKRTKYNGKH
jgi:hypothetical protein